MCICAVDRSCSSEHIFNDLFISRCDPYVAPNDEHTTTEWRLLRNVHSVLARRCRIVGAVRPRPQIVHHQIARIQIADWKRRGGPSQKNAIYCVVGRADGFSCSTNSYLCARREYILVKPTTHRSSVTSCLTVYHLPHARTHTHTTMRPKFIM